MKHHLDKRAADLAGEPLPTGSDDDLLDTRQVSDWLNVSHQFLEIGRRKGYGPKFVRVSPTVVRYRRGDVRDWLRERTFQAVSEYGKRKKSA